MGGRLAAAGVALRGGRTRMAMRNRVLWRAEARDAGSLVMDAGWLVIRAARGDRGRSRNGFAERLLRLLVRGFVVPS
jgi:hypothetical protein